MKRTSSWLTLGLGMVIVAACGGRATLIDDIFDSDEGGSGGSGGASQSSTTTTNNSSSNDVASSTNVVVASSSTGPGVCDLTGQCDICVQCAFQGPCQDDFQACFSDPQCSAFFDCMQNCGGGGMCFQICSQQFPGGAQGYIQAIQCLLCDECEFDCQGQAPPQLCNF